MENFTTGIFEKLLALVNSALWGNDIDESLFKDMNEDSWEELYQFSIMHGVFAISFDGLSNLSKSLYPPQSIYLKWAYNTKRLEKNKSIYRI